MRNISILYYLIVLVMAGFSIAFFRTDDYMPLLRNWQAEKFLDKSIQYQAIGKLKADNLAEEDAVKTAEKASLLAPSNMAIARNLAEAYYKVAPAKGLEQWETVVKMRGATLEDRLRVVKLALKEAGDSERQAITSRKRGFNTTRIHFLDIARRQLELLARDERYSQRNEFRLAAAEYLAETGAPNAAFAAIQQLRGEVEDLDSKTEFIFCRIAISTKRAELIEEAVRVLNKLAASGGETALEAIRHFSLVHLVRPLSKEDLQQLNIYLEENRPSVVDRLRIYSLEFDLATNSNEKSRIIDKCAGIFDLSMDSDLILYCHWLGKMGEMERLIKAITLGRASRSEKLFKLRLAALANLGRFEELEIELGQTSVLQDYWRFAFGARALSASRKFAEAEIRLNKLIDAIYDDGRKVYAVCRWFQESRDEPSLCHLFAKLSDEPIYEAFCAQGLLKYRGATANLKEIQGWVTKLARANPVDLKLQNTRIYWSLLSLSPTPKQLDEWLEISQKHLSRSPKDLQFRVTNALALLRKDFSVQALAVLEDDLSSSQRTVWARSRPAWARIFAVALALNQRTEESITLLNLLSNRSSSFAETQTLAKLFPSTLGR